MTERSNKSAAQIGTEIHELLESRLNQQCTGKTIVVITPRGKSPFQAVIKQLDEMDKFHHVEGEGDIKDKPLLPPREAGKLEISGTFTMREEHHKEFIDHMQKIREETMQRFVESMVVTSHLLGDETFAIPPHQQKLIDEVNAQVIAYTYARQSPKVLIVEDDSTLSTAIKRVVLGAGYEPLSAEEFHIKPFRDLHEPLCMQTRNREHGWYNKFNKPNKKRNKHHGNR